MSIIGTRWKYSTKFISEITSEFLEQSFCGFNQIRGKIVAGSYYKKEDTWRPFPKYPIEKKNGDWRMLIGQEAE